MERYACSVCGYVYGSEDGDTDHPLQVSGSFEELSEDWVCPVCGAGKDEFEPMEE